MTMGTQDDGKPPHPLAAPWVPVALAVLALSLLRLTSQMVQVYPLPAVAGAPIRLFHGEWIRAAYWGAVAVGACMVAWCAWRRRFALAVLVAFFGWAGFGLFSLFGAAGRCMVQETRVGPDGRVYAALTRYPFMPPAQDFLGRVESEGMFSTNYAILAEGSDETPHGFIVQPAGDARHLRTLESGTMIVAYGAYVVTIEGQSFGHEVEERVPPFCFIGATGGGAESDVEEVLEAIVDVAKDDGRVYQPAPARAIPRDAELADALTHANPWVRETAQRFIRAGGATLYPNATRALR